jgi:threonine dehydrogenase-like Zn-dependent dehydrogenase
MTGPGRVEVREFPVTPPEPGWVLLRILRSGICGTDLHTFAGEVLQYAGTPHERRLSYPLICGHENVGVVAAMGGSVPAWDGDPLRIGDRVVPGANVACGECRYCTAGFPYYACERLQDYGNSLGAGRPPFLFGGWSELMYMMPGSRLFRVPAEVPDAVAALAEPLAVTHALARLGDLAGGTVYVLGCGPLGCCHIVRARASGAGRILAVDRWPLRLDVARALGAETLDLEATSRDERLDAVREASGGRGADVVVEASGSPEAFVEGLRALRFGGTLLAAGAFTGSSPTTIDVAADIVSRDARVIGVGGEDDRDYPEVLGMLAERGPDLAAARIITHTLPLMRVGEGLELARDGLAAKVQLDPGA